MALYSEMLNKYLIKYKTSICKCTSVQAFLVFYIHKIRWSKNMNKETKLNKYTICHTIKQMYK